MQTELRVIDLGRGRGKVVRRFLVRERLISPPPYQPVLRAYFSGLISRPEAIQRLIDCGFGTEEACYLVELVEFAYIMSRKEMKRD